MERLTPGPSSAADNVNASPRATTPRAGNARHAGPRLRLPTQRLLPHHGAADRPRMREAPRDATKRRGGWGLYLGPRIRRLLAESLEVTDNPGTLLA